MYINPLSNAPISSPLFTPSSTTGNQINQGMQQLSPFQQMGCIGQPGQSPLQGLVNGLVQLATSLVTLVSSIFGGGAQGPTMNSTGLLRNPTLDLPGQQQSKPSIWDSLKSFGSDLLGSFTKDWLGGSKSNGGSVLSSIGSWIKGLF